MVPRTMKGTSALIQTLMIFGLAAGAPAGTLTMVKDIHPAGSSTPTALENVNGTLFFQAEDGATGVEPWTSDGTAEGTVLIKDIRVGALGSYSSAFTGQGLGSLLFAADNGSLGSELWIDEVGGNPVLLKDVNVGPPGSSPGLSQPFTEASSEHYFIAYTNQSGYELWKTDGTATGTVLVKDINPGPGDSLPLDLTNVNGTLFFRASNGPSNRELWKSDGSDAGTVMVKDIRPGGESLPQFLTELAGMLLFTADDGVNGTELWKSDGTNAGTVMVKNINPSGSSLPSQLKVLNGTLYFVANDGVNGVELWKSDGTEEGTVLAFDLNPSGGFAFQELTLSGDFMYFVKPDGGLSEQLWRTDGTLAGTTLLRDFNPTTYHAKVEKLTDVDGTLFFTANDGVSGVELWKSDGTSEGTVLAADVNPGDPWTFSWPNWLTNVNGVLFFAADDGVHGTELWAYDNQTSTDVQDIVRDEAARALVLHANVPNPFRSATNLRFDLARASVVQVRIYDAGGRLVRELSSKAMLQPGMNIIPWDGRDNEGRSTGAGVFAYQVRATDFAEGGLMVRVR